MTSARKMTCAYWRQKATLLWMLEWTGDKENDLTQREGIAKENHFFELVQARTNQFHFPCWQDTRFEDQNKNVDGYNFTANSSLWEKTPFSISVTVYSPCSFDLYLIHLLDRHSCKFCLQLLSCSSSQSNHKPLGRRLPSQSALTFIVL